MMERHAIATVSILYLDNQLIYKRVFSPKNKVEMFSRKS